MPFAIRETKPREADEIKLIIEYGSSEGAYSLQGNGFIPESKLEIIRDAIQDHLVDLIPCVPEDGLSIRACAEIIENSRRKYFASTRLAAYALKQLS